MFAVANIFVEACPQESRHLLCRHEVKVAPNLLLQIIISCRLVSNYSAACWFPTRTAENVEPKVIAPKMSKQGYLGFKTMATMEDHGPQDASDKRFRVPRRCQEQSVGSQDALKRPHEAPNVFKIALKCSQKTTWDLKMCPRPLPNASSRQSISHTSVGHQTTRTKWHTNMKFRGLWCVLRVTCMQILFPNEVS